MNKLLPLIFFLLLPFTALATNYANDANNVGFFGMEDSVNETDRGGNTNNTLTETSGTIPQNSHRAFGTYSRDFELGDSEYFTHADGLDTDINGEDQHMSIVLWYKGETTNYSGDAALVTKYNFVADRQYRFTIDNDNNEACEFRLSNDGSASTAAYGTIDIHDKVWHHLAGVYDDTDLKVYVDGSLDLNGANNPKTYSSGIANKSEAFVIGCSSNSSPTQYIDGLLDDVAIFDRELTSVEISDIETDGVEGAGLALTGFLVSYWDFDESSGDLIDVHASTYDGSLINNVTQESTGIINTGYYFDGTGDQIEIQNGTNIDMGIAMSISAWVYPDTAPNPNGGGGRIISQTNGGTGDWFGLIILSDRKVEFRVNNDYSDYSNTVIPDNAWTHIVCVYDGTSKYVYLNTVEDYTRVNDPNGDISGGTAICMGQHCSDNTREYAGLKDEIGLWSRVLNESERAELYNGGDGLAYPFAEEAAVRRVIMISKK